MIDIIAERTFPLGEAGELLPVTPDGAKPSYATLRRWARQGRLEVVVIAGRLYTSHEAIVRMVDRDTQTFLTAPRESRGPQPQVYTANAALVRKRAERAAARLEAKGF